MGKLIKRVNHLFADLVPDEAPRFFCLHLPFWGFLSLVLWHVAKHYGPHLLWAGVAFWLTPYLVARLALRIYGEENIRNDGIGQWQAPKPWILGYAVMILVLIGIPGWYFGLIIKLVQSSVFNKVYWGFLKIWFEVFNFYRDYKFKELEEFARGFSFRYWALAWSLMVSSVVMVPALFYFLYGKTKEKLYEEELAQSQQAERIRSKRLYEEAQAKEAKERKLAYEAKKELAEKEKLEKQKKIQERLDEIKGKDPWDSGFL